jgi:hypothetical protein
MRDQQLSSVVILRINDCAGSPTLSSDSWSLLLSSTLRGAAGVAGIVASLSVIALLRLTALRHVVVRLDDLVLILIIISVE